VVPDASDRSASAVGPVLAVIGARSGSKGLPDKNVRDLAGHPLLAWIVAAARRATTVDRVVVSTDSPAYAAIARSYGAETPVPRPAELAGDTSTDVEFVRHLLDRLAAEEGYRPAIVVRLVATAPLQQPEDIDAAVTLLRDDPTASSVMVVAEARQHPAKALRMVADAAGRPRLVPWAAPAEGASGGAEPSARQAYAPAYLRANVVATRTSTIEATGTLAGDAVAAHLVPADRSIDIDTELDLAVAACLIEARGPGAPRPEPVTGGTTHAGKAPR
jgi:CMP-N,N'-diacetyllegionaminic acid synthase